MWTHNRRICLILTLHTETRFENMASLCSHSPWQRHVRILHHSVALHIELCGTVISVSFCFTWHITVYFTFSTMSLDGRVAAGCFFRLHNAGESTHIFLSLFFWVARLIATFRAARLTLQTWKFWLVGVATDRPPRYFWFARRKRTFLINEEKKMEKSKQQKRER